jgi:hypothetical protein
MRSAAACAVPADVVRAGCLLALSDVNLLSNLKVGGSGARLGLRVDGVRSAVGSGDRGCKLTRAPSLQRAPLSNDICAARF